MTVFLGTVFVEAGFFAAIFLAVAVLVLAGFLAEVPVATLFRGVSFAARCVVLDAALAIALGATARTFFAAAEAAFGRETLTSPRMGRPGFRAFPTAALAVGLRVGLLRGVEAMGATLGTVET